MNSWNKDCTKKPDKKALRVRQINNREKSPKKRDFLRENG